MRFRIKSSAMDTWRLVSLVTHLNWPGFLQNFLAFSSLQQFQVKSSRNGRKIKWLNLWLNLYKFYINLYTLKIVVCSLHVSIEPMMERSFITELEEKLCCTSISLVWWHGYRDYRDFWIQPPWRYWPMKLFSLINWGTGNRRLLIDFYCYLSIYLPIDKKIVLIFSF